MVKRVLAVLVLLVCAHGLRAENSVGAVPDVRRIDAAAADGGRVFEISVEVPPEAMARAFLVYELAGLPHWTAAVRSINGLPALGGFRATRSSGTGLQVEEINPRWLRPGLNQVVFEPAPTSTMTPVHAVGVIRRDLLATADVPYTVRNLRLVWLEGPVAPRPQLTISHPSEYDGQDTILRGFVDPRGAAELFVNETYVPQGISPADGSFSVFVPATGEIRVEVVYADGSRLRQSVQRQQQEEEEDEEAVELDVDPTSLKSLGLGKARLDVTPGSVSRKTKLTIRGLRRDELPAMDAGMTNVTPGQRGFRLGPHGLRFTKAVQLRLPYDVNLIPKGMSVEDVRTYFFDEEAGRWVPLPRVDAVIAEEVIVSATDHFTDFVNATLAMPDEPAGTNHSANSLQELAKADPASGIVQIDAPEGDATGDAMLGLPIEVPPGRLGMEPSLNVRYDSSNGDGWLGVGWGLQISAIEISTTFGVPRYDGSERYLVDGEHLAATSTAGVFVRRAEGSFDRIVRHGTGPANYWWEVTDKNGVRSIYGQTAAARLSDPRLRNTFRWYLEKQIDLHGNTIEYEYVTDVPDRGADGEPWVEVYPAGIRYTGGPGVAAFYRVTFTLDDGSRPDRLSSGRPGFKTYTRHRLARINVHAGAELVRQYVFTYRIGDFQKSLLQSIAVMGQGGAAEFYRHTFDYTRMATEADGYDGFAAQQAWGGMSAGSDLTDVTRIGAGAHGFAGLGPPGCQPHGGIQAGGSGTDSAQNVVFLDVNGDGLPDRLDDKGNVDLNRYDPADDATTRGFRRTKFNNAGTPGHTSEWSLDFGAGVHAELGITAALDATWVWSHANDDHVMADVNGDMRPDLVSTDNGFNVRINNGSSFLGDQTVWNDFSGDGLNLTSADEEAEVLSSFALANPLRQLVLPYDGRVTLTGAITKKYDKGDGVEVAIYHNSARVWSRTWSGTDTAPCTPGAGNSCNGGLAVDVKQGDSLYFLSGSIRDTDFDALAWSPVVTYDGEDAAAREPYGARVYVFDASDDFALAGHRAASWTATATGTVRVTGALVKQTTSDDITLTVMRSESLVFTRTFAADEAVTFEEIPAVSVVPSDQLFLTITSRTPIDPKRVQWTPTVTFEGATEPSPLPDAIRSQPAQVAMVIPDLVGDEPTRSWTPSSTGDRKFSVKCDASSANFYVQGVNHLFHVRPVEKEFDVTVAATAGQPLFFTLVGEKTSSPGECEVDGGDVPVNVRWQRDDEDEPRVLSGGHHGWFYGEWNGNVPFNAAALVPPEDEEEEDVHWVAAVPRWDGTKGMIAPVWTGGGFDSYLAAEGTKPSRTGQNAAGVLDEASGSKGGKLSVLRKTSTRTAGIAASAGVGLALSMGDTDTKLDLLDMNGDLYPDQVSSSGVRFSNGVNGFGALKTFPGLGGAVRGSEDGNISASIGIGINFTRKNGKGKATAVLSTLPTVGTTISLSQTTYDLIDVNGDSLPDRVSMEPGSGSMTVQLNLGYRFGVAESWSLPKLSEGNRCQDAVTYVNSEIGEITGLDTLNGIAFTRSSAANVGVAIGPFGGGVSTTLARTLVELVDVNGDGLPDRVAKDHNDAYFRVQLNLGDRWADEQRWYVPGWSAAIGSGYNPTIDGAKVFQCLDAVSFSGHVEMNASAGAPICIPLVPPIVVAGLQIEISAQTFGSLNSGLQLFLEDLDGDGLADHVLKRAGDEHVYVKRNQAGGVNLLKSIYRPLGSTIELSYERRGNTPDNPFSQWVLSRVNVDDGRGNAYATHYAYGNDAFYDRNEREHYGYPRVVATLPDGSKVEREFLNDELHTRYLQTRETLTDANGALVRVHTWRYENQPVTATAIFPAMVEETTSMYEGTPTAKTVRRVFEYDGLGNVVATTDYADSGTDDDVVARIGYQFSAATHLTQPVSIEVRDGNNRLLRKRQATYNAAGDLTRLEQMLIGGRDPETGAAYTGSKNAVSTWTHDALGNAVTSTEPSGFTSTITYDPATRSHPIQLTDSFGYVTRSSYDLKYGHVTETIDQNGNAIRRAYDHFGRLITVVGPYDNDAAPTLSFEYGVGQPISWAVVHHKDSTRSDTIDASTFIDSLGRVLQVKEDAELDLGTGTSTRTGMRVSGKITFDAKGRVATQGQPVFDDRPARQFVEVASKNATTFTHDALDRVRSVRFPNGAVTRMEYTFGTLDGARRFLTVRTDPNGRATRLYRDVSDRVLGVEQTNTIAGAKKTLVTRYAYDALEQLLSITDAKNNVTRLEYDTLGRNVVVHNPDLGRTELRYDPAGNLKARITANLAAANQQIRYLHTYGRLDRIDYPQSPDVVFTYGPPGAPFNRANRVVTVADGSGLEERFYGKLGEVVQTTKITSALNGNTPKGPYTTRFEFDSFSRLLSVVYPDGETLTYGYDAGGKVKSAAGLLKGVRFDYLRHLGYDEFGQHARMLLGNGMETRYAYEPASRYLAQIRTTAAGRDLQNLRYQYDLAGALKSLQNDVPVPDPSLYGGPSTQTFAYDDLMQLVSAQGRYQSGPNKTSTYSLALAYDEIGNTVAKNQLHQTGNGSKLNAEKKTTYNWAYAYGGAQPHAATRIGERTFHYDANGNQVAWESSVNGTRRTLVWNEENRLASVADNGQTTRFLYDAGGTRTNKAGPHGETIYVNRWFTLRNGAIASKHVFADEIRLATKVSPDPEPPAEKVYFFAADHLGSTQFVTDERATVYQHLEYFAGGEVWVDERSETQRTPYLFSGKELDEETGLSPFGHRYYDARQGQWLSVDPILENMLDTSTLSRPDLSGGWFRLPGHTYAYAANNPANFIDPHGLMPKRKSAAVQDDYNPSVDDLKSEANLFRFQKSRGGSSQGTLALIQIDDHYYMIEQQTNNKIKDYAEQTLGITYLQQGRVSGFHAEMRFVKHARQNGLDLSKAKIWVSKPICRACTDDLAGRSVTMQTTKTTAGAYPRNWVHPDNGRRNVPRRNMSYRGRRSEVDMLKADVQSFKKRKR